MNKKKLYLLILLLSLLILTGCWNYRELEQLALLAGVAIDKDERMGLQLTTEIITIEGGAQETKLKPAYITIAGKTFFDSARRAITLDGRKLFWSHAKVIVLSQSVATNGLEKVLDFLNRDAEAREDIWVVLSKEATAKEILMSDPSLESITSFQIDQTMRAQSAIPIYPNIELYRLLESLGQDYESGILPTVKLVDREGKKVPKVTGTALFDRSRLAGFIDELETFHLLFARGEIKGGVYPLLDVDGKGTDVSLEIFKSRTKVQPLIQDGVLTMKVTIMIDADIGEITGTTDFINSPGRGKLAKAAEEQLKANITKTIRKIQKEFKLDVLKFAGTIKRGNLQAWKILEKDWKNIFPELNTQVDVLIKLKRSAVTRKPIMIGD